MWITVHYENNYYETDTQGLSVGNSAENSEVGAKPNKTPQTSEIATLFSFIEVLPLPNC